MGIMKSEGRGDTVEKISYLQLSYPNFQLGEVIDPSEANQNNYEIRVSVNETITSINDLVDEMNYWKGEMRPIVNNEEERILMENTRMDNESYRLEQEMYRADNERDRVENETKRVEEFEFTSDMLFRVLSIYKHESSINIIDYGEFGDPFNNGIDIDCGEFTDEITDGTLYDCGEFVPKIRPLSDHPAYEIVEE